MISCNRKGKNVSKHFFEASITLRPKPNKDITRKLETNIPHKYRQKFPNIILKNCNQQYVKE